MIEIIAHKTDGEQYRMDKGKIEISNSKTGKVESCGILEIRSTPTLVGQTYYIECGRYMCGDEVIFSVTRGIHDYPAMIALKEMTAYYSTG
jgi:hypothetical protein